MSPNTHALDIQPLTEPPDATITVPGSKSLTNRALVCAALAQGQSTLSGALLADDTRAMAGGLESLGARVLLTDGGPTLVDGIARPRGSRSLTAPVLVDAHLSGTTARFLLAIAALADGSVLVDGGEPLRRRPMGPLLEALHTLGCATTDRGEPGHLPQLIAGSGLTGGAVSVPGDISSQFVTALLLAGPLMRSGLDLRVTSELVARPFVDLTRDVMAHFGAEVECLAADHFRVTAGEYRPASYQIEPDATAASYFFAAAAMTGGRVRVPGLGRRSRQGDLAFLDVLASMGAQVQTSDDHVEVRGTGTLRGVDVDLSAAPDVAQTVAVVAACASGPTRVRGVALIRGHETDRIAAVVTELRRCGIAAHEEADGFVVEPGRMMPARVHTYDDHRMAMSFALLGLVSPGITILDPGCTSKTFPRFFETLASLSVGSRR